MKDTAIVTRFRKHKYKRKPKTHRNPKTTILGWYKNEYSFLLEIHLPFITLTNLITPDFVTDNGDTIEITQANLIITLQTSKLTVDKDNGCVVYMGNPFMQTVAAILNRQSKESTEEADGTPGDNHSFICITPMVDFPNHRCYNKRRYY